MSRTSQAGAALLVAAVLSLLMALAVPVGAAGARPVIQDSFDRLAADVASPSGHTVLAECPGAVSAAGWPAASADLRIHQSGGESDIVVTMRHVAPNAYYTIWLRLGGTDSNGDAFGRNPVTGGRATPLAASNDLPILLAATGSGNGNDQVPNGFRSNSQGNATFTAALDFPVVGGAYPFQRFPEWDPTDDRLPTDSPAVYPVAIAGPQGPFTLRIVSHCTDDVGHGLGSGPRELWFDWKVDS